MSNLINMFKTANDPRNLDKITNKVYRKIYKMLKQCGGNEGLTLPIFLNYFKFPQFLGEQVFRVFLKLQPINIYTSFPKMEYATFLTLMSLTSYTDSSDEKLGFLFLLLDYDNDGKVMKQDLNIMLTQILIHKKCYLPVEGTSTRVANAEIIFKRIQMEVAVSVSIFFLEETAFEETCFIARCRDLLQNENFLFSEVFSLFNLLDHQDIIQIIKQWSNLRCHDLTYSQSGISMKDESKENHDWDQLIKEYQTDRKRHHKTTEQTVNSNHKNNKSLIPISVLKDYNENQEFYFNTQEDIGNYQGSVDCTQRSLQFQKQGELGQVKSNGDVKNEWFVLSGKYMLIFSKRSNSTPCKIINLQHCFLEMNRQTIKLLVYGTKVMQLVAETAAEEEK